MKTKLKGKKRQNYFFILCRNKISCYTDKTYRFVMVK